MKYTEAKRKKIRAAFRDDLIRRLFAIAISAGFVASLFSMNWAKEATNPTLPDYQQIFVLAVAMIVTVLSWDGYLMAIKERPLFGYWRFLLDILLVFTYMFLFFTSRHQNWWLPILSFVFGIYCLWDFLTVCEHTPRYGKRDGSGRTFSPSVWQVYWGALSDDKRVSAGPIISIVWALVILISTKISLTQLHNHVFGTGIFIILTLILYRQDKSKNFGMVFRMLIGVAIVEALFLYLALFDNIDDRFLYDLARRAITQT